MNKVTTTLASLGLIFITIIVGSGIYVFNNPTEVAKISPELSLSSYYSFSNLKSKVVAASCGFTLHGSADEYASCTGTVNCCYGGPIQGTGQSQCGGTCTGITASCPNAPNFGQPCTTAANSCGVSATGTYDACGVCNVTTPPVTACTYENICGESFAGQICGGSCVPTDSGIAANPNASCIKNFKMTADSVSPGGSVEFSWSLATDPDIEPVCGFVDLTAPTPRPIPGLQNLSPATDKIRITNIQTTSRFCLVCQFKDLVSNNILGETAVHQWIRVIRVGEN